MPDLGDWSLTAADNANSDAGINWAELQNPDTVNNSSRQEMARVAQFYRNMRGALVTGGAANAYTVSVTSEPTALSKGWIALVKFVDAATGASTFKVGALAAQDLRRIDGSAMIAGIIGANSFHWVMYDTVNGYYRILTVEAAALTAVAISAVQWVDGGGTGDAITATYAPAVTNTDGVIVGVRATAANTITNPTFNPNGLGAKTIKKRNNQALVAGDIAGNDHELLLRRNTGDDSWNLLNPAYGLIDTSTLLGKQKLHIPATAMLTRTTNGASVGGIELGTNRQIIRSYDFDPTTQEFVQFWWTPPKAWNEGTVTFAVGWSHAATVTNFGVVWALEAVCFSDDDAQDAAFGTAVQVSDTGGTTNDLYRTSESAAVTISGSPAANDHVCFQIKRVPADGSDTLAIDARLQFLDLYFTIDAFTEA